MENSKNMGGSSIKKCHLTKEEPIEETGNRFSSDGNVVILDTLTHSRDLPLNMELRKEQQMGCCSFDTNSNNCEQKDKTTDDLRET